MRLSDSDAPDPGGPKPPPNYFSRGVQYRLLVLVGMFMLVILMMIEAGKPKNWEWMWAGQVPDPNQVPEGLDEPASELSEHDRQVAAALQRTQQDGWRQALEQVKGSGERELRVALKAARDRQAVGETAFTPLVEQLDEFWKGFHDRAFLAVAQDQGQLEDGQKEVWLEAVEESKRRWGEQHRALQWLPTRSLASSKDSLEQAPYLAGLMSVQLALDRLDLQAVQDNKVLLSAESDAWFRLLEKLQQTDDEELADQSLGPLAYLQLYQQPQVYRGKVVTIRGVARLAYHVEAPENIYGIPGYYIFWVKVIGGPNSPVAVYSLEKPPGFPKILDKDRDGATTTLSEDVEFTGYFFKRWVYRARGGPTTAPLLLARSPRWEPRQGIPVIDELPSLTFVIIALAVALLLSGGVAGMVYTRSRWRSAASAFQRPDRLQKLAKAETLDVAAQLRLLADSDPESPGEPRS